MSKVLVVATSRKTRGGITSVIKAHETGDQWKQFHCHWVETHRDGPAWRKILYFAKGMADFLVRVPFYDVVHLHVSQPVTIKRKTPFIRIAKALNKKVIVHFHAFNIEDTFEGKDSEKYVRFFNNADRVIVLSNWWKEQIKGKLSIPIENIKVLYNPCPIITKKKDGSKKGKIILYAGTVNERKGYSDLIKSFAKIAANYPEWKVVFAGNGEIEQGKQLAKNLGIENQVEFAGWVGGEEKDMVFRKAMIFCLPSYAEGFPMAVLDAWAYGLPVITTPVGGIPDVAKDGENMLLFNPGNTDKLAKNIEKLITDSELRDSISKASVDFASGIFNINTINSELGEIYDKL